MGMKLWYVNVEGFKVEAETYDEAWDKAEYKALLAEQAVVTDVTLCEEEYCSECLEYTCKDNPRMKGNHNE